MEFTRINSADRELGVIARFQRILSTSNINKYLDHTRKTHNGQTSFGVLIRSRCHQSIHPVATFLVLLSSFFSMCHVAINFIV